MTSKLYAHTPTHIYIYISHQKSNEWVSHYIGTTHNTNTEAIVDIMRGRNPSLKQAVYKEQGQQKLGIWRYYQNNGFDFT